METLNCASSGRCSGCCWITISIQEQRRRKQANLLPWLQAALKWVDCGSGGLRDRADLTWQDGRLGLFEIENAKKILDFESCPMFSPALEKWLQIYREKQPSIQKGSVRLRVSPSGQRGAWLDFANVDVKNLFEERHYLKWLSEHAIVEIGQRKKRLEWRDGKPKLVDPQLAPWFETYSSRQKTIPLYTVINGFTQSGFAANRALVTEVLRQVASTQEKRWLELFAGSGNFSLALAASGYDVTAIELDELAVAGMKRSCDEAQVTIEIRRRDLYKSSFLDGQAWLVDPPRSGLKTLIEGIAKSRPHHLIYVSCWTDSFNEDAEKLRSLGYQVTELAAVDQFIHSPHVEWVATFRL